MTNKIFGLFMCYELDEDTSFMQHDFSISCKTGLYTLHTWICALMIFLVPLGIPFYFYREILSARSDILRGQGPHHLENLYKEYRPECCMWEVYQMLQKVMLIGLLTFVARGSIVQCVVGFSISNAVLLTMIKVQPYSDPKTNLLAIVGEGVVCLAFLSALLIRMDLKGEALTVDMIGGIIIASNVPMMVLLCYDTVKTIQEEIIQLQKEVIKDELGGKNAQYRCIERSCV
eukprot:COSAG02_NODE_23313_length_722_cov_1.494382_1_plen_230_part_10